MALNPQISWHFQVIESLDNDALSCSQNLARQLEDIAMTLEGDESVMC